VQGGQLDWTIAPLIDDREWLAGGMGWPFGGRELQIIDKRAIVLALNDLANPSAK
jgi:hypothetical protein